YHNPRQRHLRLVTPGFLAEVHRALGPGGLFVTQTDNPDYWAYMNRVLPVFFHFESVNGPWPDAPQGRSRREILARSRGLTIYRGVGTRRDDLDRAQALALAESLPQPTFRTRGPWDALDALEGERP
ncbi:MAG TPA: tRNA (guanine-N7)-methyltransferase, partial [Isosphaeraceae bacterium]|nr:tRNA (guanine-N7)-methyltransferase [Isosphaeraceae bacterium]